MLAQANQVEEDEEEEEEAEESIDFTEANGYTSPLIRQFFQACSAPVAGPLHMQVLGTCLPNNGFHPVFHDQGRALSVPS
jgi:hypothetical protein